MPEYPGAGLLGFMLTNTASMRAKQYRQEAAKFRAMAETQSDWRLHRQLLELAQRYDELASSPADKLSEQNQRRILLSRIPPD